MTDIDFVHDSLAEITTKQQRTIERLGTQCVELALENMELREGAEGVVAGEHQRLVEALILVENWMIARASEGAREVDAEAMLRVLRECFAYSEERAEPPWFAAAVRAMGGGS